MSSWEEQGIPNPGSDEAGERGCTCAVMDNHRGRGITAGYGMPDNPVFWVSSDCPLHGLKKEEETLS